MALCLESHVGSSRLICIPIRESGVVQTPYLENKPNRRPDQEKERNGGENHPKRWSRHQPTTFPRCGAAKRADRLADQLPICSRGGGVRFGGRRSCFLEEVRPRPSPNPFALFRRRFTGSPVVATVSPAKSSALPTCSAIGDLNQYMMPRAGSELSSNQLAKE